MYNTPQIPRQSFSEKNELPEVGIEPMYMYMLKHVMVVRIVHTQCTCMYACTGLHGWGRSDGTLRYMKVRYMCIVYVHVYTCMYSVYTCTCTCACTVYMYMHNVHDCTCISMYMYIGFSSISLQMSTLLELCVATDGEAVVNKTLVDDLVHLARGRDDILRGEGLDVQLEEDLHAEHLFQIPGEGYSGETVSGVPGGLQEFLQPMISAGMWSHYQDMTIT